MNPKSTSAFLKVSLSLLLGLILSTSTAFAGPKLAKLKKDVRRIKAGTLLIAPIMEDSFVLKKLQNPKKADKLAAYRAAIVAANQNMKKAITAKYTFSKVEFMPAFESYEAYFEALKGYDSERFFVLQFGHMVQYADGKAKRIRAYDRKILGIFETDGKSRMYLNAGKVKLFEGESYAQSIILSLNRSLTKYSKARRSKNKKQELLIPAFEDQVALLPQEELFGSDSTTFQDHQWQTVVTVKPVTLYRVFGGKAMPNGSFAGTSPVRDTAKVREELAILPDWGNNFSFEAVIEAPVATKMQIGIAAAQPPLTGGGDQVILPYQWSVEWIKEVHSLKTKETWTLSEFKKKYPSYFKQ